MEEEQGLPITFTVDDYYTEIDDPIPMVISVKIMHFAVHRVSIDQGSSANILYRSTLLRMDLSESMLRPFEGFLAGLTGKPVEVKGYVDLDTTFGEGEDARTIKVRYLVIDSFSPYNIVIGRPTLNALGAVVSTSHLTMKYPAGNGRRVGVVRADLRMARQCYNNIVNSSK